MTLLILGVLLWIAAHYFNRVTPDARAQLGDPGKGLVALGIVTALVLMIIGYRNADFIYAKNWSAYEPYGQILGKYEDWMIDGTKMALTNQGKFMHCLPVRRNVVVSDKVLDSEASLVIQQANNRTFAAQAVLKRMLEIVT